MDIPELIRQLLELKFRLNKEKGSMQILVTTKNVIRVWFWMKKGACTEVEMDLKEWSTQSRNLLSDCWHIAATYDLLDEQQTLSLN